MTADAWRIVGGKPLRGRVTPSGSKNGALPTLAATLLLDGETVLHNVPRIADVNTMLELLRSLGLQVTEGTDGAVRIINTGISSRWP
jgi:UDP-N-acetylglucosamine 1-carboxyvinyltransferase